MTVCKPKVALNVKRLVISAGDKLSIDIKGGLCGQADVCRLAKRPLELRTHDLVRNIKNLGGNL